ncbi:MAG: helix-turn-helix domain-containing protein [Erysipelotrichaceae bacterium]|nr:helix-turn-helix domain-containing protein [Erysipelotrichaceae bacterium]
MSFAKNLRHLRRNFNLSQNDLANRLGYKSFTTIQKWEDGSAVPPYKTLEKIAEIFSVDVNSIMSDDITLSDHSEVPILGIVRGGEPIFAENNYIGLEHVFPDDARHSDCFYLQVVGDSMKNARILPDDLVYVHKQNYLDNGEIGVFLLDNSEATIKRIQYRDGNIILQPENDDYSPIVLTAQDVLNRNFQIIGKVLHNRIRF